MEIDLNSVAFAGLLVGIAWGLRFLTDDRMRPDVEFTVIERSQDDEEGCWS